MTGFLTDHWALSLTGLLVLNLVGATRRYGRITAICAIATGLFILFLLTLRTYGSVNELRRAICGFWVEISFLAGAIITWLPSLGYYIRVVVAVPVAWIGVIVWTVVFQALDTIIIEPVISLISSDAGALISLIGNTTNVFIFLIAVQIVAGHFRTIATILGAILVLIIEWSVMASSYHECSIVPMMMLRNDSLTWWQWLSFAISAVVCVMFIISAWKDRHTAPDSIIA